MNIWKQSLEEIAAGNPPKTEIDLLPGVPETIRVSSAACVMAVSEQTVLRMIEQGHIAVRNGRVPKTDLLRYIRTHTLADMPVLEEAGKSRIIPEKTG
ncbi:MAG: hypothetical protein LBN92_02990 [Treponema sp.]|jgi:hypothetical protein|nr:hypothetical protein [Treponema sp.]